MLVAFVLALTTMPIAGQGNNAQSAAFDVVTIKPSDTAVGGMGLGKSTADSVSLINVTAKSLIRSSYEMKEELILGGPGWIGSDEYDVEAKVLPVEGGPPPQLNRKQISLMMQAMLADRFKLAVHSEMREIPVYELTVAKSGQRLKEAAPGDTYSSGLKGPDGRTGAGMMLIDNNKFIGQAIPLSGLVDTLSLLLHRVVVDKTGLPGKYDVILPLPLRTEDGTEDENGATLLTIVEEQLGLKLTSAKGKGKVLVIDHIERPSPN
jgi:uncharacterized protein (TIGR03435 family)